MDSEGRCRLCAKSGPLTRHHLVPEHWFRKAGAIHRHKAANIVPLCQHCHRLIEGHVSHEDRRARLHEARRRLRAVLLPEEVAFVQVTRGRAWLDHHYPATVRVHQLPLADGSRDRRLRTGSPGRWSPAWFAQVEHGGVYAAISE